MFVGLPYVKECGVINAMSRGELDDIILPSQGRRNAHVSRNGCRGWINRLRAGHLVSGRHRPGRFAGLLRRSRCRGDSVQRNGLRAIDQPILRFRIRGPLLTRGGDVRGALTARGVQPLTKARITVAMCRLC
jgi:hypothetical protein